MPSKREKRREGDRVRAAKWYAEKGHQVRARWARTREWVWDAKAAQGCATCGEGRPQCLDFHHREPADKKFVIGSAGSRSRKVIETEMAKCVVLCRNCHAILHWEEKQGLQG